MRRLLACLLLLIATVPAAGGVASQSAACEDVSTYFARADEAINEGMAALDEQPGFRDAFASGMVTSAANGTGFLALSPEEQEALITYFRMPGEALAGIEPEGIPDEARDLHDSAAAYWTLMPDMMQAIADESPSAAMPFFDDLDTATSDNVAAQDALMSTCPDEVTAWADAYDRLDAPGRATPAADPVTVWDQLEDDGAEGLAYPFLFFASDDDAATPAASTPTFGRRPV